MKFKRVDIEALDDGTFSVSIWPKEEKKKGKENEPMEYCEPTKMSAKSLDDVISKIKGAGGPVKQKRGTMASMIMNDEDEDD